ncbi:hypothetical protein V8G54_008345 [Vigna mungo]|uniref:Uncharacterized protein n=1 Tax=Vigna mungo TaxID=3915 RepID=A0AAQ3P715_VIGMU
MPKRRTKKSAKARESIPDSQIRKQPPQFMDLEIQEMEREIGTIRARRDADIKHWLTELRLLRSRFSSEELRKPVLQVFEETMPNLSLVIDERNKNIEVKWRENEACNDGMDVRASLLQGFIASISRFPGFDYSASAGRMSFIGADNLQFKDNALEESSDTHTLAVQEGLQTPGVSDEDWNNWNIYLRSELSDFHRTVIVTSQRFSIGMTPKTVRVPKPGEMLFSVHQSPLGVFKENNMEAIHGKTNG